MIRIDIRSCSRILLAVRIGTMILCPFCHFQNEDGALFCEQCKSDLSGGPEVPAAAPEPVVAHPVEAVRMAVEPAVPLIEAEEVPAQEVHAEPYPLTAETVEPAMEAMPLEAMPVEAVPV